VFAEALHGFADLKGELIVEMFERNGERYSRRTLDMPRELAHELKLWKLKCPPSDDDLVFTTVAGGFIHRKNAGRLLHQIIEQANLSRQGQDRFKRFTFHKLRQTFASLLLSKRNGRYSVQCLTAPVRHAACPLRRPPCSYF
jgi:integrase